MTNHIQIQSGSNAYLQLFNQAWANYEKVKQEAQPGKGSIVKSKLIPKIRRRSNQHS